MFILVKSELNFVDSDQRGLHARFVTSDYLFIFQHKISTYTTNYFKCLNEYNHNTNIKTVHHLTSFIN